MEHGWTTDEADRVGTDRAGSTWGDIGTQDLASYDTESNGPTEPPPPTSGVDPQDATSPAAESTGPAEADSSAGTIQPSADVDGDPQEGGGAQDGDDPREGGGAQDGDDPREGGGAQDGDDLRGGGPRVHQPQDGAPAESPAPVTGLPAVDAELAGLGELADRPLDEHVQRFEQVHQVLSESLSGLDKD